MGVSGMCKSNAMMLVLMIVINTVFMSMGSRAWTVLGLIILLGGLYLCFRQGMGIGREACGIQKTVNTALESHGSVNDIMDKKYMRQAWSRARGLKALFASALFPYTVGCVYIILSIMGIEPAATIARVVSWLVAMPYWPLITYWYDSFVELEPAIVLVLMVSPFIIPAVTFAGYMQGPKLWKKTEEAMAQGKRRAKAKSRIVKKQKPRVQKPEI